MNNKNIDPSPENNSQNPLVNNRRGSNSKQFDIEWTTLHQTCIVGIEMILANNSKMLAMIDCYGSVDDSSERRSQVDRLKHETVVQVTRTNVDVIQLAQLTDAELDLTVAEANELDKIDSIDDLSPKLITKKREEVRVSKEFKDAVYAFQSIQKQAAERAHEFVMRARAASGSKSRREKFLKQHREKIAVAKTAALFLDANDDTFQDLIAARQSDAVQLDNDASQMSFVVEGMDKRLLMQGKSLHDMEYANESANNNHNFPNLPQGPHVKFIVICGFVLLVLIIVVPLSLS